MGDKKNKRQAQKYRQQEKQQLLGAWQQQLEDDDSDPFDIWMSPERRYDD